jgi:ribonuclease HI
LIGWFDGVARATGLNSGAGVVIRINENIIYNWVFNCGLGTNTIAELLGAWALLALAIQLDILEFYVQGDSQIIID